MQLGSPAIIDCIISRISGVPILSKISKGIEVITLTPLGVKFVEACIR
jgi:hypothetical protein